MLLTCAMTPRGGLGGGSQPTSTMAPRSHRQPGSRGVAKRRRNPSTTAPYRTDCCEISRLVWLGRVPRRTQGYQDLPRRHQVQASFFISSILEGINTMFWRSDCGGGDESEWNLAKSAAIVRDAKPESDVHSILPKQRSPVENTGFKAIKFEWRRHFGC